MKLLVLLAAFFSLSVSASDISKYECSGRWSRATIEIGKDCASINLEEKVRARVNCPRCSSESLAQDTYRPIHEFTTCEPFSSQLTVTESNEVDGKYIIYNSSSHRCLRLGCLDQKLNLTLLDKQDGTWELKDFKTSKIGDNYSDISINQQYSLPAFYKFMTCTKI